MSVYRNVHPSARPQGVSRQISGLAGIGDSWPKGDKGGLKTSADRAYSELKALILAYKIPIMRPIQVDELALRLKVSRTPVREALYRLRGEGLVNASPKSGFFVGEFSEAQIHDLYEHRLVVEGAIAYQAAANGTPAAVEVLSAWWRNSYAEARSGSADRRVSHNEEFCERLAALTYNTSIADEMVRISERVRFFRAVCLRALSEFEAACTAQRRIISALAENKPSLAFSVMRKHLQMRIGQAPAIAREAVMLVYMQNSPASK